MGLWYVVKVACVLCADGVDALLGVFCGGMALPAALVVAFFRRSGCAGVGFEMSAGPVGLCGGLALIGGCAGDRLDLD